MMRRFVPLALTLLLLAGCGGGLPPGDPARGEQIYTGAIRIRDGNTPACIMCHPVHPGEVAKVMGQNLSNIGNRAAREVPGQSAEEYLRVSIVEPDAHLAGGFQEGIMYRFYGRDLTPQQISDLIAYMLTLKSGVDQ
jgi:hypothetical protein